MIDINSPIFPMVNSLFEEDCLDCMKRIPDGTIDMTNSKEQNYNCRKFTGKCV